MKTSRWGRAARAAPRSPRPQPGPRWVVAPVASRADHSLPRALCCSVISDGGSGSLSACCRCVWSACGGLVSPARGPCSFGADGLYPWVSASIPAGQRVCPHGSVSLSPWVSESVPMGQRVYPHGSASLSPWVSESVPMGQRVCPHGSACLSPWVSVSVSVGQRVYPRGAEGMALAVSGLGARGHGLSQ